MTSTNGFEKYASRLPSLFYQPRLSSPSTGVAEKSATKHTPGDAIPAVDITIEDNHTAMSRCQPTSECDNRLPAQEALTEDHVERRFADITEFSKRGMRGIETQIMLTERFCPPPKKSEKAIKKYQQYSVVLQRTLTEGEGGCLVLVSTILKIQSKSLGNAFRELVRHSYDSTDLNASTIQIRDPFAEVFFSREQIRRFVADRTKPQELRDEMKLLYNFIKNEKNEMVDIIKKHEEETKSGIISADILWTIYPPDELVVVTVRNVRECWICRNCIFLQKAWSWMFKGIRLDFDGTSLGFTKVEHIIPMYPGTRRIEDLPVVPIAYISDWKEIKSNMMARGRKFSQILGKDLQGYAHHSYQGPAWRYDSAAIRDRQERNIHDTTLTARPSLEVNPCTVFSSEYH